MDQPPLFPVPRKVDHFDPTTSVALPIVAGRDKGLAPQGYELSIDESQATLCYADEAGRRYGEATLAQLRRPDGTLPAVVIRDHPDFTTRGYLLDVSRDRVPTRSTLDRLVERLSICRYNQLQLYIEHTFAHPGHEAVWTHASPITPEDLRWLDDRCASVGIELVANQNTFGHFGRWLSHDTYRRRAECPDGYEIVDGFRLPPTVLAPTASNADFALELVRNQLACVRSRRVNIGCDETFELGKGVSAGRVAEVGLGHVYLEHLRRIIDPLLDEGSTIQFWADVALAHPEILDTLPDHACIPIAWNYDAPGVATPDLPSGFGEILARIGIDLDAPTDFATILEPLRTSGHEFWVAPGTSSWQSLVGRLPNARANLTDAAIAGRSSGASGYLVTDWGDSGHLNPPAVSIAPMAFGGTVAWCAEAGRSIDLSWAVNELLVGDTRNRFGGVLETIGTVADQTGIVARNASPLFYALVPSPTALTSGHPDLDQLDGVIAQLEEARVDLADASPTCGDAGNLVAELDVAIGLAIHGAKRLAARAHGNKLRGPEAAHELARLIDRYRSAWSGSSRPGGFADSVAGLEATLERTRSS